MKKYKCTKCNKIVEPKEIEPKFETDSDNKIKSEINRDSGERLIYQRIHKECGGPVIEIDLKTESRCNKLYKKWKELAEKLLKTQLPSIKKGQYEPSDSLSNEEREELNSITEELAKKYLDYLSIDGRYDIEQRMVILGKKLK